MLSITDQNGNAITDPNHVGNLSPFRYRGYYYDTESGFYYLMSRYYDPVTHRFINADDRLNSDEILGNNVFAYCNNNPIMYSDPDGHSLLAAFLVVVASIVVAAICTSSNQISHNNYRTDSGDDHLVVARNKKNKKGDSNWTPRKDPRKGSENRQKSGDRERNVAHPNGEEHSRVPKGNGLKRLVEIPFKEYAFDLGICIACTVAVIYIVGNDITGFGVADDIAVIPILSLLWDSSSKAFG